MPDRRDLHQQWLMLLTDERARRSGMPTGEEATAWLIDTLDQMGERMRAAPDFVEPSPAEAAALEREIAAFFKQQRG
jgi:hypothetical protein